MSPETRVAALRRRAEDLRQGDHIEPYELTETADEIERLLWGLNMLGNNLHGNGLDALKPISVQFAMQLADLADALARGEPHERFDATVAQMKASRASPPGPAE